MEVRETERLAVELKVPPDEISPLEVFGSHQQRLMELLKGIIDHL